MSVRRSVQTDRRRYNPALSLWRRRLQMPSKKPNKAAKKPGKAIPRKATRKVAVAKKAARPPPNLMKSTTATSKVTVKPHKTAPNPAPAKPAVAHTVRAKQHAAAAPVKTEPQPEERLANAEKIGP